MTLWTVILGLVLGALGAAANLAVTRWRARAPIGLPSVARFRSVRQTDWRSRSVRTHGASPRGAGFVLLTFPLSLLGPAAAILLAIRLAPESVWAAALGLVATRWLVIRRSRGRRACCGGDE